MWLPEEHVVEESEKENGNEMVSRVRLFKDEYEYEVTPKKRRLIWCFTTFISVALHSNSIQEHACKNLDLENSHDYSKSQMAHILQRHWS